MSRPSKSSPKAFALFTLGLLGSFVFTNLMGEPIRGMFCLAFGFFFLGVGWVCASIETASEKAHALRDDKTTTQGEER